MRFGIVGSRSFIDYDIFLKWVLKFHKDIKSIVSGGAVGADSLAERYAKYWSIPIKVIRPKWEKHGRGAGFIRNTEIVQNSDMIIAFWDGQSSGTKNTIDKARNMKCPTLIVYV